MDRQRKYKKKQYEDEAMDYSYEMEEPRDAERQIVSSDDRRIYDDDQYDDDQYDGSMYDYTYEQPEPEPAPIRKKKVYKKTPTPKTRQRTRVKENIRFEEEKIGSEKKNLRFSIVRGSDPIQAVKAQSEEWGERMWDEIKDDSRFSWDGPDQSNRRMGVRRRQKLADQGDQGRRRKHVTPQDPKGAWADLESESSDTYTVGENNR